MSNYVEQAKARSVLQAMKREGPIPVGFGEPLHAVVQNREHPGAAPEILRASYAYLGWREPERAARS